MHFPLGHLAYCTNIHPAETWQETMHVLKHHALAVRDLLDCHEPFALGLRLSAQAAAELQHPDELKRFQNWLQETNTYVFTINGFPYGGFHGQRVKERVFQPDWTSPDRVLYTKNLFRILSAIAPAASGGSVSTLPGSHKLFRADEAVIIRHLQEFAIWLEDLSDQCSVDLHLGLEPEPFGHIENTAETIAFFEKLKSHPASEIISRRIGLNYDACHFAIQFDDALTALDRLRDAGIRLSKIHLSNALSLDAREAGAIDAIRPFDEPTYFHQVIAQRADGPLARFPDLPDFLSSGRTDLDETRVHFHIPLDAVPPHPLGSTRTEVESVLSWCGNHPGICQHYEIETYTWAVLPDAMRRRVEDQIADEYRWVLSKA